MLAELVDAVVGVDTHRDTHHAEIALPSGAPIATRSISNDSAGYAELLAWMLDHAPGPRLVVAIEGTRSYGVGLARAVAATGLMVVGNLAIYAVGVPWLMASVGTTFGHALMLGVVPFLIGDAIKILLAAVVLPGTWRLVRR